MSTLKTDTLSNTAGSKSVPMATVVDGSAKAWVNFNGTGTVAIRAAFNVSSITDNGVGDYTVNFSTPFVDTHYTAHLSGGNTGSGAHVSNLNTSGGSGTEVAPTVSALRFSCMNNITGGSVTDGKYLNLVFFR